MTKKPRAPRDSFTQEQNWMCEALMGVVLGQTQKSLAFVGTPINRWYTDQVNTILTTLGYKEHALAHGAGFSPVVEWAPSTKPAGWFDRHGIQTLVIGLPYHTLVHVNQKAMYEQHVGKLHVNFRWDGDHNPAVIQAALGFDANTYFTLGGEGGLDVTPIGQGLAHLLLSDLITPTALKLTPVR